MKNNNAIISDIIQALEDDQLTLKAIDGKLCKFATARTKRQDAKKVFGETARVTLTFDHARWEGNYVLFLRNITDEGIVVVSSTLTPDGTATVHHILNAQTPKSRIEIESEIIAGCRLLGANYLGDGKFITPCRNAFQIPLTMLVTAQQVRDAVICELALKIGIKPKVHLTRI